MVLEVIAAVIVVLLFVVFASKIRGGNLPKGRLWNALESFLLYIRDHVARPAIGHDADKFLPFLLDGVLLCSRLQFARHDSVDGVSDRSICLYRNIGVRNVFCCVPVPVSKRWAPLGF